MMKYLYLAYFRSQEILDTSFFFVMWWRNVWKTCRRILVMSLYPVGRFLHRFTLNTKLWPKKKPTSYYTINKHSDDERRMQKWDTMFYLEMKNRLNSSKVQIIKFRWWYEKYHREKLLENQRIFFLREMEIKRNVKW